MKIQSAMTSIFMRNYVATTPKMKMMPLHGACHVGNQSLVKMMAMTGMELNHGDKDGDTPLHYAVYGNRPEILEQLARCVSVLTNCTACLDVNTQDKFFPKKPELVDSNTHDGCSALHLAVVNNHYSLTKTLLTQSHCTVDLKNSKQQTALLLAVYKGYCDLVELLLEAGAQVNEPDEDGNTPMHMSLMMRSEFKIHTLGSSTAPVISEIANELLQSRTPGVYRLTLACFLASRGGDLHRKNKAGQTSLDLAGGYALVELLLIWKARNREQMASSSRPHDDETTASAASEWMSCKVCVDARAEVWLEPCGHLVYCSDCSRNMNGCLTCGMRITGKVPSVERSAVSHAVTNSERALESRLKRLEEVHN
ncbi:hypothetical protein MTO96_043008, partial [Rhipicephalus appendiculatus]